MKKERIDPTDYIRRSSHGSRSMDELVARMRDAGYADWEIKEELAEMEEVQKMTEANKNLFITEPKSGMNPLENPLLASSVEAYVDNAGSYHIFALDGKGGILGLNLLPPAFNEEALQEIENFKSDPTSWRNWDPIENLSDIEDDGTADLKECRRCHQRGLNQVELIDSWNVNADTLKHQPFEKLCKSAKAASQSFSEEGGKNILERKEVR